MKRLLPILLVLAWRAAQADTVTVQLELPALAAEPYHRPYVSVWLETQARGGVHTLALWYEKDEWLKDLRQWWRKLGGPGAAYDAVTGPTRRPGVHAIIWDGRDAAGARLPAGTYLLMIEVAREAGGREFLRQPIELGAQASQRFQLSGTEEIGRVDIATQAEQP